MARFWEIVKRHPYWIGGGVLFGVLLIWLVARKKPADAGATGPVGYTQDPNVTAANAATGVAQIQTNAAVSMERDRNATAVTLGQQQAGTLSNYFGAQQAATKAQLDALVSVNQTGAAAAVDIARVQSGTTVALGAQGQDVANKSTAASVTLANIGLQGTIAQTLAGIVKGQQSTQLAQAQSYYSRSNPSDWGYNAGPSATNSANDASKMLQDLLNKAKVGS